ncbi:MAG: sodium transporter [Opitutaceae bacterium]
MSLHPLDVVVMLVYSALVVSVGWYVSRRSGSTEAYFLGKRDFPGWAVGLSFIGATISSVTFIAYPADSFKTAWVRFLPNLAFPFIALLAAWVLVPFFRRGRVKSAYHYLGLRFGMPVSVYAALVYLLAQGVRMATITYLLSVLLSSLTGLGPVGCIGLAAGITALYTVKGGFEAVVWNDVLQTLVLVSGALACVVIVVGSVPGGLGSVVSEALAAGKLSFTDLDVATGRLEPVHGGFSLLEKTIPMMILVGAAQYVTGQLDQDSVQRWSAARSLPEARKSMWVLGFGALPIWAGFMFLGTCLWVYYQHHPDPVSAAILAGTRRAEDILPHFILTVLPPGIAGLVISGALAAAMGSLSCCINAASMVWVNDLYRPHLARGREDRHYLRVSRGASLGFSAVMAGGAYLFHISNAKTIMELGIIATALFGGGISGAFLFGLLTRRGDHRAVIAGIVLTAVFTGYTAASQAGIVPRAFNPYYTAILANLVMFVVCAIASWVMPAPLRDLRGLTFWEPDTGCDLENSPGQTKPRATTADRLL